MQQAACVLLWHDCITVVERLSTDVISALSSAEVTSTVFFKFSEQGESEGDPLHRERSVA